MHNKQNIPSLLTILLKNTYFKKIAIGILVTIPLLTFYIISEANRIKADKEFIASTIPASATIIKKHNVRVIEFDYTTQGGEQIRSKINTKQGYISKIKAGDTLTIFYDPHNPKESFLPQELKVEYFNFDLDSDDTELVGLVIFITMFVLLYATSFTIDSFIKYRLFRIGNATKAKIIKIKIHAPKSAEIKYSFTDTSNKKYKGKTYYIPIDAIRPFVKKEKLGLLHSESTVIKRSELIEKPEINVLYNPKKPKQSVWADLYN